MNPAWEKLTDVAGSLEGEVLKSYLEANGIEVRLIQESVGKLIGSTLDIFGLVEVFVPQDKVEDAQKLLEVYQDENNEDEQE